MGRLSENLSDELAKEVSFSSWSFMILKMYYTFFFYIEDHEEKNIYRGIIYSYFSHKLSLQFKYLYAGYKKSKDNVKLRPLIALYLKIGTQRFQDTRPQG